MRKIIGIILVCVCVLGLCACSGDVSNVMVEPYRAEMYTEKDVNSAIKVAKQYFKNHFSGCKMTVITYAGDDVTKEHIDWAERNNADEAIVLKSSFDVDSSGGDGSLSPNYTYNNWSWILVRNKGGNWKCVDYGY